MKLKSLSLLALSSAILVACSTPTPVKTVAVEAPPVPVDNSPIVFEEPAISPAYYALNPSDYSKPPVFEVNLQRAKVAPLTKLEVSTPNMEPTILSENRFIVPLTDSRSESLKFAVLAQDTELDVTDIDDFINILEGKARHYPVQFASKAERAGYTSRVKTLVAQLDPLALRPTASYDVILRAFKLSVMARNLDMGDQFGPKALAYGKCLLAMQPNDPTANLWLGFSLSEGGAFKEATPYLQKAMDAGVQEAHLSMANNFLYMEQKRNAITTLRNYKVKYPTESAVADRLISEIESGQRYNVWQK
ncbi:MULTISPECIES: ABUW_2363 family tetratricopeptide repeat lipoprotein [unclassified Acinetobacter]|uniref:ABUW_2363 family tetratricopeptide repeat lipoprotein n=1 Tax=unclassified Acinetobacter TaxID=196816 RepID=UPI0035BA12F6